MWPCNESHYNAAPSVAPRHPRTLLATADKAGGFQWALICAPFRRAECGGTAGCRGPGGRCGRRSITRTVAPVGSSSAQNSSCVSVLRHGTGILKAAIYGSSAFSNLHIRPEVGASAGSLLFGSCQKCSKFLSAAEKGKELLPVECVGVAWTVQGEATSGK